MKKYLLLALLISGCMVSEQQSGANLAAQNYIRHLFDDPKFLEPVSFSNLEKRRYQTALDSSMANRNINDPDNKKIEKFVDSENSMRPDIAPNNVTDMYNIEHNKLIYYALTYTFRIDSNGIKKLKKYRFELDSANNVLNAKEISLNTNITE
jgi:hypothetical protein